MPAKKSRVAVKTALLAPAGSLLSWGIQQAVSGEPEAGMTGIVIGVALMIGFVTLQEYDLSYESEIIEIVRANTGAITEGGKEIAEGVGDAVDNTNTTEREG